MYFPRYDRAKSSFDSFFCLFHTLLIHSIFTFNLNRDVQVFMMLINEIKVEGLSILHGSMGCRLTRSGSDADGFHPTPLDNGAFFGTSIKKFTKNRLRISSPEICFEGSITTSSMSTWSKRGWELGFVQNILKLERIAHYGNNDQRCVRQNPENLPIRDGDDNMFFWYEPSTEIRHDGTTIVNMSDSPNMDAPIKFSGNLEGCSESEEGDLTLIRTSGQDVFETFLVALNERYKRVLVLAGYSWTVDWSGKFSSSAGAGIWIPQRRDMIVCKELTPGIYPAFYDFKTKQDLPTTAILIRQKLPFNPNKGCADQNFQLSVNNQNWVGAEIDEEKAEIVAGNGCPLNHSIWGSTPVCVSSFQLAGSRQGSERNNLV